MTRARGGGRQIVELSTRAGEVDDTLCGTVTVLGPGYHEVTDVRKNYASLARSSAAFGEVRQLAGVGEEAVAVDLGSSGAHVIFRTMQHAALVMAKCRIDSLDPPALAERAAREIADRL